MKKHISRGLILSITLCLALIGTAYAALSSQVAEFFSRHWGGDMGIWLQEGRIAQIGESITMGGVSFTLDEVVYRSRGLYGVGTARAVDEKDVLLSNEYANEMELFAESETAQRLLKQAKEKGGRLLTITAMPEKIGVDGGEMLTPGSIGYYDEMNEDGSITFSFEVEDGYAIADGSTFSMEMWSKVCVVDDHGVTPLPDLQDILWTVEFTPTVQAEKESADAVQVSIPQGDYELLIPAEYQETGSMPIYRAIASDFTQVVQPEWFNQTGIADQPHAYTCQFNDHAILQYGKENIYYSEYTGEMFDINEMEWAVNQSVEPSYAPTPALSSAIANMASWAYSGWGGAQRVFPMEKEALTFLTLQDAQTQAEELLHRLGIEGFTCAYALDMSVDRIHTLGAEFNEYWYGSGGLTNLPRTDYQAATTEDEGFFLIYCPMGVDQTSQSRFNMSVFVTKRGIVYANIRSDYLRGEMIERADHLITPDEALNRLPDEAARSRYYAEGMTVVSIQRIALTYGPDRAENKADGMVFTPMWQILYQDENAAKQGYTCYAEFNAITGELMNAIFH
ncbi:MAG: DUF4179 domain-containing protein [Clostridia bacterium]|nr:DUF4179 domain-containing protein [Clostridia bacterium]